MPLESPLPPEIEAAVTEAEAEAEQVIELVPAAGQVEVGPLSFDSTFAAAKLRADAQAAAAEARCQVIQHAPGEPTPLDDLRERIRLLQEALVERYEDGNLRITFDLQGRRDLLRPAATRERW